MDDIKNKEVLNYLSDLDNLIETGHFSKQSVRDYTFHHKTFDVVNMVCKGREIIRSLFQDKKNGRLTMIQSYYSKIQLDNLTIDDILDLMEKDMKFLKDEQKN